jgi:hypothetical protein
MTSLPAAPYGHFGVLPTGVSIFKASATIKDPLSIPSARPHATARVFKNRLKYDLKSIQIICPKYDLKSQSNPHFPKRFKIKIKSNRFTQWRIILVFLVPLSTCIIILKMLQAFSKNKIYFYGILLVLCGLLRVL